MINPALREIQDFVREHRARRSCRNLYNLDYYNIYYYLSKLCRENTILPLTCESGYRKRYCITTNTKLHKRRLHTCIRFVEGENNRYIYRIGTEEILIDHNIARHHIKTKKGNTFVALYDRELLRYYILLDTVFLGVIRLTDRENPRLPGPTYGYGTEYSRCLHLFKKKEPHRILSLVGHRRVTGSRLS